VWLAGAAAAQEATSGSIAGQVVDAQGLAIPGATVIVDGPTGPQTFVSDEQGRFVAPLLRPATYSVRVELQGFRPVSVEEVNVALNERKFVPITLRVGTLTEQVEVVSSPPAVDVSTSAIGANLESEFLNRLPTQRHLSDVVQLAPGVTSSGGAGEGNPSISGASGLENQYVIDGVNITNTGYGALGSYSIVFGSLGSGVPFDFIKEVQVKTAGYEAEFGQSTGGVVLAVTKSGSNVFRGSAFGYWEPGALEGEFTEVVLPNATRAPEAVNTTRTLFSDVGFEVGGPLVENRLFFFGALDRQWNTTTLIAPPDFPLRSLGEVDRDRTATAYSGKVTYQVNATNRLDLSVFGDPAHGDLGPQRRSSLLRTDTAAFSEIDFGGHNQTLRYEGVLSPTFLLTASVSRSNNSIEEFPSQDTWSVLDTTSSALVRSGGIGFYEFGNDGTNTQYQAKASYFAGNHEVAAGLLFEDIDYTNSIDRTGPSFTLPDGTQTATGAQVSILPDASFGRIYRVTRANITNIRETRQNYFAFYAQDTWRIGDRLTVRPGIRYEQQELIGNLETFTWDGNWAPRIGATWDPTGEGRMKVFGNWGRYFAKVPNDLAARALSADAGVTRADYFDPDLTRPIPNGVLAGDTTEHFITAGLSASDFDPESKSTYSDEWAAGAEYELLSSLGIGVNYIHRNFGRVLEDVGTLPMVAYFLPNVPGADSVEYFITNPDPSTPIAATLGQQVMFEEAIHDYDALTFTAEKRLGNNWGLQSSYRVSWLEGTFEGFFRNDNDQSDPAITSLFDFPTNDPTYVALGRQFGFRGDIRFLGAAGAGPLPLDRRHQFKVYGSYVTEIGLTVGLGLQARSGTPLTALAANPVYESAGEIPETPRGAGFETVDGFRERTPWENTIDLHAGYSLPLGGNRDVRLVLDVFNVFDAQSAIDYDDYTEVQFSVPNPDFGRIIAYQQPREVRVGARFGW
jgi:hypothetical protein